MRIRTPALSFLGWWVTKWQFPSTCPFKKVHLHWIGQPKKFMQEGWIGGQDGDVLELLRNASTLLRLYFHSFFALPFLHPFLPTTKTLVLRVSQGL